MAMVYMWTRIDGVWRFTPIPGVTVEPCMTSRGPGWHALYGGKPIPTIRPNRRSDYVRRAVWEYFDRRVDL